MEAVVEQELPKLSKPRQELFDIVLGAQRNGTSDMTNREIQDAFERRNSCRIGEGTVSSAINRLVALGYLTRSSEKRRCKVTGSEHVSAVFVPEKQARLFA